MSRLAADGTKLAARRWEPDGRARSTIVLVHGIAEHSGRYEHVGSALAAHGHQVVATDLRGFGASGGRRAFVERWDQYLDDLEGDVSGCRSDVPTVLMGHSMGGLVALSYVLSDRTRPDLLVLSAPAISARISPVKRMAARVLGVLAPRVSIDNGLDGSMLSRDPEVGHRYFADPLVHPRTTLALGRHALAAQRLVRRRLSDLDISTLVLHGAQDQIVPEPVSRPLESLPGVERIVFPGFRHESFNEDGGAVAVAAVADWLNGQIASTPR